MAEIPRDFRFLGGLRNVQIIARGRGVRVREFLKEQYGGRRWRKMKGVARVETNDGYIGDAEIHWYEAHGVGAVGWKVKRPLET